MKKILFSILFISSTVFALGQTSGQLTVSVATSEAGGGYAPRNIVAIWVENSQGDFVKTLLAYANSRKTHLNTWQASTSAAGTEYNTTDAVTGATKSNHATRVCSWDATDYNGAAVTDGEYFLRMELTDKNGTGNYSSFTFNKGHADEVLAPDNAPSFNDISIIWDATIISVPVIDKPNLFSLLPNPNNGIFTIIGDQIDEVEIRSISGSLISKSTSNFIDISEQNNGIYLAVIYSNGQKIIQKIVKK